MLRLEHEKNIVKHSADWRTTSSSSSYTFCRQPVSICLLNCRYDCIPRWVFHSAFLRQPPNNFPPLSVFVSVAKSLGYKIIRPSNNQMPKASLFEFNYEMRYAMQNRKQEQDMWNICWTDSIVAVDFCREMRRFQKINVGWVVIVIKHSIENLFLINSSTSQGCSRFAARIFWREIWIGCWSSFQTITTFFQRLGAFRLSKLRNLIFRLFFKEFGQKNLILKFSSKI